MFGIDYKKVNCKEQFLELQIFIKNKKGEIDKKSFFFSKGIEIRNLVKEISKEDNFDVKTYQNEYIFEFQNGDYGRYVKNIFSRCKKP
jgi:hypothetical protein